MQFVTVLLYVVEVVICLLLGLVVMIQKPKEGGLGGAFGSGALADTLGAEAGNVLIKATAILGTVFLVNTMILARITSTPASVVADEAPAQEMELPADALPVEK